MSSSTARCDFLIVVVLLLLVYINKRKKRFVILRVCVSCIRVIKEVSHFQVLFAVEVFSHCKYTSALTPGPVSFLLMLKEITVKTLNKSKT